MAVLIGVVKGVVGQVFVVHGDGSRRAAVDGERLFAGDTLDTGTAGAVAVHLTNGNDLTLGRGSSLQLTAQLLSDQPPSIVVHDQVAPDGSQLTEVQQVQQAIAAGADPTQTLEATAAGPAGASVYTNTPAGDLGGGHSFVLLTETAGSVAPVVGFPTEGLGFALLDTQQFVGDVTLDAGTPGTPVVPPDVPPVVVPPDNGITFVDLYRDGGEQRVYEADLPDGTNTAQGKGGDLSRTDVFSVVAPDGLASLTIDGVQVVLNGQLVSNTDDGTVRIVGQLGNTLTISGYDPATGVFDYTYVLSVDQQNNQTTSNFELSEDFHLVAVDTDGDTGDAWLNVRITDDSPIANNDVGDTVTQQAPEITGNVLTNDFVGADTNANPVSVEQAQNPGYVVSGQTIIGTYGTLTLGTDGTYTYVLNPDSEAFQAYKDSGQAVKETFTYTLTDGDGDSTTANLTVNIAANNKVVFNWLHANGGDLIFDEADLPNGTSVQPDKADWLTDHSSLYIDAKDGLANLSIETLINGVTVTTQVVVNNQLVGGGPITIVGESGNILTIDGYSATTGILQYTYVLSQPGVNNPPSAGDLANTQLSDDFKLIGVDTDGDTGSAWINITIKDDAPIAVDDSGTSLVTDKAPTLSGTVLANDKVGADTNASPVSINAADNPGLVVSGQTVEGKYGTLTLNADGTYDYVLNSSSDAFIALKASGQTAQEVFTYTLTDGDGDSTTAKLSIDVGVNYPVEFHWLGSTGGDLEFKEADLPAGTNTAPDKADFLTDHSSVYIDAKDGLATLSIDTIINGQVVTTQVVVNGELVNPLGVVIPGESGNNLTVTGYNNTTGELQYSYTLDQAAHNNAPGEGDPLANTQLSDDFKLVATDTDGDTASAWINVTIKDDSPVANDDQGDATVSAKLQVITGDVLTNDNVGADSNATPVSLHDADGNVVTTLQGLYGTLELGADGKYTYTLNPDAPALQELAVGQTATDTFTYTLTDGDGDSTTAKLDIEVKCDPIVNAVPVAAPQEATVTSGATGTNVILVIDVSNSMNDIVKGTDLTRLALAKQAVDNMLDLYAAVGDVKVQVTTFNNQTHLVSDGWVDVATAIKLVNGLTAGGGTNYDYALDGATQAYGAQGKLEAAGVQTVSYFVSDGNPTLSSTHDHVTAEQSGIRTDTALGDGISGSEAAVWTAFLEANAIKSYAIGIGNSVQDKYLNPIAFDGTTGKDIPPQLVRDVTDLQDTLGETVQGKPVTGSLLDNGGYGADGGYVKSITVDGVKYSFDGNDSVTASSGTVDYKAAAHELTVQTAEGGALQVNLLTGAYTYTAPAGADHAFTETVLFTLTDTDGDLASNVLTVHVLADTPVLAPDETIITNVLDSSIEVPAAALLANAGAGTELTSSTTFDTAWGAPRGADFTGSSVQTINFRGTNLSQLELERSQFASNTALMTAALVVAGTLGAVQSAYASDTIEVQLKKGETVHVESSLANSHASLAWAGAEGIYSYIGKDGSFTATEDGVYSIQLTNLQDAQKGNAAENYSLQLTVDYSNATTTPVHTDTYSVSDGHGGSATGAVAIHYQAGDHLVGTNGNDVLIGGDDGHNLIEGGKGDDVLVAGQNGDDLYGNDGNDLLISGAGDDTLDGGAGNNTVSYQTATSGVRVDLAHVGEQDTGGGGHDTLSSIQNLIGSSHDDVLIGDANNNIITGGQGNDTLTGGGGSDTFKWLAGDTGHDTITDFKLGGDTLDLSQLLQGENSVANSLENFLQFKVTGTGNDLVSTIEISSLGNNTTTQTISLEHVDIASTYGVQVGAGGMIADGHDTATIISGMLNDHSLKTDTV